MEFSDHTKSRLKELDDLSVESHKWEQFLKLATELKYLHEHPELGAEVAKHLASCKIRRLSLINEAEREMPTVRSSGEEISQEQVAKDFGVTRQAVIRWEQKQTVDGPGNKSNKYGYYRALRLDPNLRGAYELLVLAVQHYRRVKAEYEETHARRFSVRFCAFYEEWIKHNS